MKTRYNSLVSVKKNIMQRSEEALHVANTNLESALIALESSCQLLSQIDTPASGDMSKFLTARMLLDAQREMIKHNEEWVAYTRKELSQAKNILKEHTLEYEKFNYLELQEIQNELKRQKKLESKNLDEVALMTFDGKRYKRKIS